MNPSELRSFLDSLGVSPKKSLSQNFLTDKNVVEKIVKEAHVNKEDTVLEIGAGPGSLTVALLAYAKKVIAIEKDWTFAKELKRFSDLEVFEGDVRDFSFDRLKGEKKVKVVSNLPYHLTSPILGLLMPRSDLFSTLTLMVQEEVARRIVASPSTKDYSALSVFIHFYGEPRYAFKVGPNCFFPAPKVHSAIVTITLKKREVSFDPLSFFGFVKKAFMQRRKMLRVSLGEFKDSLGDFATKRPENLSIEEWIFLYERATAGDGSTA